MEPERPCLDGLDRLLDSRRAATDGSSAPKGGHACPECEGLGRVVDELRGLPTACGQPGDDALVQAIQNRVGPVSPPPATAPLTPLLVGAALLGAGLLCTLAWQSRSPQSSPAIAVHGGIASESSPVPATPATAIDLPVKHGAASGVKIGIIDPDVPTAGIK